MVDAVDKLLRRYPDSPIVEDVLGTLDAGEIRARVAELDPACEEIFFFQASVGALFGLRRRDGSRVAMKIHKLFTDEAYFDEVQNVQSALAAAGWPAPKPLGRRGLVTWEEWRDAGEFRNAHEPDVRRAMARALARFHQLATATRFRPRRTFLPSGTDGLWPVPHNALFDFEATKQGAEWIDEIARAAKVRSRDTEIGVELVGHTDWSAKHLRFDERLEPTVLYDWDSVTTDREPNLVGTAAGSFTYTEELDEKIAVWPSAEESLAFIDEYESARGAPFRTDERDAAQAACVYLHAYAVRCHHSYGGDARKTDLEEIASALL
ncbi:MAG: phosphotransferase [Actinomycetota bacterium]|nr:phosphotransferase [Actinomycetota bacterium]